jgi:hypothetical protein
VARLELNSAWGLPDEQTWDLYRWYPNPARLAGDAETFGHEAHIRLRPFDAVLLEVLPSGQSPALDRTFDVKPIRTEFAEPSRSVEITVGKVEEKPQPEPASLWTPLEPHRAVSAGGATLTRQRDGSVLAGGENPSRDSYTIAANTELAGITAIRLEVLPDGSLPASGPGRAVNGNFALTEFRVMAVPGGKKSAAIPVVLKNAAADFSQETYGGWPAGAAIDGDPKTGWSIDPQEGRNHVAVFETEKRVGAAGGTSLTFTLDQGERGHNIGRLRLSVTNAEPPIPPPKPSEPPRLIVTGEAPASAEGGTLVVSVKMTQDSQPAMTRNVWNWIEAAGCEVAANAVPIQPVVGKKTHALCWQAWRIDLEPSTRPQDFRLSLVSSIPHHIEKEFKAYFIPNSEE